MQNETRVLRPSFQNQQKADREFLLVRPHSKRAVAGNRGGLRSGDARQGATAKSGPV